MFKCGDCGNNSKLREKVSRLVVETRVVDYSEKWHWDPLGFRVTDDKGGVGTEIVREIEICGDCAQVRKQARAA